MKRFIKNKIVFACAVMFLFSLSVNAKERSSKPNVLFISIDDLNDWIGMLGATGHPDVKTPNLDRLAARGVYFANNHANTTACTPSRLSVMTGLSAVSTGCYTNKSGVQNQNLWNEVLALPAFFRQNNYYTMACGKIEGHACHGIEKEYPHQKLWDERLPRGFLMDEQTLRDGQGYGGTIFYPFPKGGSPIRNHNASYKGHSLCAGPINPDEIPGGKMPDELAADWAVERLKREYDVPFMLGIGFVRPHVPYTAPKQYFDMYPVDKIYIPTDPIGEMDDIPLYGKAMAYGVFEPGDERMVRELGCEYRKELVQGYLACVTFMDAQLGKVLDALDNSNYADNTIIILWSDHGQHLGEKRSWRKQCLWQESTNSPMLWVVPGLTKGEICKQPSSLLDIYPTLIQLCGLNEKVKSDGISLLPQLKDVNKKRSQPAVTTWTYGSHAVRDERWHYIRYYDGSEELYDADNDYGEHYNLAENPDYKAIIAKMKKYLPQDIYTPTSNDVEFNSYKKRVDQWKNNPYWIPEWLR
ncbi:sulfatase [Plebeiibacterium marinum]|uniref:Sulfatase n=1 Tax=Plebeiibacterium marinum TaxID=2992111 RepID=A0AAE3MF20_9BACT|nr:sulfatase [Plebeiobacterium marinum]MCW3806391.1 sulfatase [Plebeiobacterium marinum]